MSQKGQVHVYYPHDEKKFSITAGVMVVNIANPAWQMPIYNSGTLELDPGPYAFVFHPNFIPVLVGNVNVVAGKTESIQLWIAHIKAFWPKSGQGLVLEYSNPADEKLSLATSESAFTFPTMPPGVTVAAGDYHIVTSPSVTISLQVGDVGPKGLYWRKVQSAKISPPYPGGYYNWDPN